MFILFKTKRCMLLLLLWTVCASLVWGAIPAEERAALIAIYNATHEGSLNWKTPPLHTDGFSMPGTEGNWTGIVVAGDHVTEIDLGYKFFYGSFPPEICNLVYLKHLDLAGDYLSGTIPSAIGNLTALQYLDLAENNLGGSIPPELWNLTDLQYLNLNSNHISGGVIPSIENLNQLQSLYLNGFQFNGAIPVEIGNLSNLQSLELVDSRFSGGIPPALGNLANLKTLNLNGSQCGGGIPPELGNLSNLEILILKDNLLTGGIPPELGKLSKLKSLLLGDNRLSGPIPSEIGNLGALEFLLIGYNLLSGEIPYSLKKLKYPINIVLANNCLITSNLDLKAWLDKIEPGWDFTQNACKNEEPIVSLNRTGLSFRASASGRVSDSQKVWITNVGGGTLNWSAVGDASWLTVAPASGTGNGNFSVSINPTGLAVGNYTGTITITDVNASNSPQTIAVTLNIINDSQDQSPFGEFTTPWDGTDGVMGSIAVTGWALDDIGLESVKIYRQVNGDLSYIGDAIFIDGARPDVEQTYPGYPNSRKAGWGYLMLTNLLPDGDVTLKAIAKDNAGNETLLGTKTITIDNTNAEIPFGAIDTPTQGGDVSGKKYINFGWALTPQPDSIAIDGSTIKVVIDGVAKGHPVYNIFRADIANLFPGLANTNGAIGYFYIDASKLKNGLHTIAWSVTDNAGHSDGIGSRYFSVMNSGTGDRAAGLRDWDSLLNESTRDQLQSFEPVMVKKGYNDKTNPGEAYPDECGDIHIQIPELERLEIKLDTVPAKNLAGYLAVGDKLRELPIGSTLDSDAGIFYWQPGAGFVGEYHLVFTAKDETGQLIRKNIVVTIVPKAI